MTVFFIVTGAISLSTLTLILLPLFRRRPGVSVPGRGDYDIAIYQDQLKEVDKDVAINLLGQAQAEAVRTEIKRRMLAVGPQNTGFSLPAVSSPFQRRALIAAIVVLLPLGAFSLYFYLGVPGLPSVPFAERVASVKAPVISDRDRRLMNDLASRMEKNPKNIGGWLLLGRSYSSLGLYVKAAGAYKRALKLSPDRADIRSDYGEALVLASKYIVSGAAEQIFTNVLRVAPRDFRARYYLGLAKAQRGDVTGAIQDWVDLLAIAPKGARWQPAVEKVLAAAAKSINLDPRKLKPSAAAVELAKSKPHPSVTEKGTPAKRPSRAMIDAINSKPMKERAALIRSMVERLAKRLEANPGDADGWRRLAHAYQVLGDVGKAEQARKRANNTKAVPRQKGVVPRN